MKGVLQKSNIEVDGECGREDCFVCGLFSLHLFWQLAPFGHLIREDPHTH